MESWAFLAVILIIACIAKNQSLAFATLVVMLLKLLSPWTAKWMEIINSRGISWGVTLITIAILIPIATGKIGFHELWMAFRSPLGWCAIICGALVAILSAKGVHLIDQSPEITVALVFGTILGVVLFRGIAAGPVIAAGLTYCLFSIIQMVIQR